MYTDVYIVIKYARRKIVSSSQMQDMCDYQYTSILCILYTTIYYIVTYIYIIFIYYYYY